MSEVNEQVAAEVVEEPKEKKHRATTPIAKYPEKPTRIVAIDSLYIKGFFAGEYAKGKISKKELGEWSKRVKELIEIEGNRGYFQPFRTEFVKKYFPELLNLKPKKNNESISDFLDGLLKN